MHMLHPLKVVLIYHITMPNTSLDGRQASNNSSTWTAAPTAAPRPNIESKWFVYKDPIQVPKGRPFWHFFSSNDYS